MLSEESSPRSLESWSGSKLKMLLGICPSDSTIFLNSSAPFQHDYYALKVDRALIFVLPDDYVEDITLSYRRFQAEMRGSDGSS